MNAAGAAVGRLPVMAWPGSTAEQVTAAADAVRDWPRFAERARDEGVLSLLAARLCVQRPASVPPDVLEDLDRLRAAGARRSLRMAGQLLRILELFESTGIEAMPIKGPVLAEDVYGDATLRAASCDLDIVVRPSAVREARGLLLANGFEDVGRHNERLLRRADRGESEVHLRRRDGEPMVDLHWRLTVACSVHAVSTQRLLAEGRTVDLLGRSVRAPSLRDQLLLGLVHGARHEWLPLELRLAAALQVARLPRAEWPALCADARAHGCLRRVVVGVAHACAPFPVMVPEEVAEVLARDAVARGYLRHLASIDRAPGAGTARHIARLFWTAAGEDTAGAALDHALIRGLRPGPEDWDTVHLPEELEGLYWAVRPARLASKYAHRVVVLIRGS